MNYFSSHEFDSPDLPGSGNLINDNLVEMLNDAREIFGKPIVINSGYRTKDHNEEVGGKEDSSHLKGLAADISCVNSMDRFKLYDILRAVGFQRIGVGKTFIHVDVDFDKDQDVFWVY
jgi:uncharacterized protein YcbK (DUF882 family)